MPASAARTYAENYYGVMKSPGALLTPDYKRVNMLDFPSIRLLSTLPYSMQTSAISSRSLLLCAVAALGQRCLRRGRSRLPYR